MRAQRGIRPEAEAGDPPQARPSRALIGSRGRLPRSWAVIAAVPDEATRLRESELLAAHESAPYQASKCYVFASFLACIALRPDSRAAFTCTPDDVVDFLIASDANGKTTVHASTRSSKGRGTRPRAGGPSLPCSCPTRLAWGTVDSMIGRLRSNFHDLDKPGFDPAATRPVKRYLGIVRNEQSRKGIVPTQSKPILLGQDSSHIPRDPPHSRLWGSPLGCRQVHLAPVPSYVGP
jgi:hypothetical protein